MAILQCKMCGGKVRPEEGKFTATCEYCGSEMTLFESTAEFEVDSRGVLVQYNGKGGDVVIPDDVRCIGKECFQKNERVFTVKLPESVTEIRDRAFDGCTELEEINIPASVETIGHHAFSDCSSLCEVVLPDGLMSLKQSLFLRCRSLRKVTIGKGLRTMEDYVFSDCEKLEKVVLPETLKRMGSQVFENCFALKSINIPDKMESVSYGTFKKCRNLAEITIPDSITEICGYAFYECTSLQSIRIPDSVRTIGTFAFNNCKNLTKLDLGNGVETIETYAFSGCSAITGKLVFPESLRVMAPNAFSGAKFTGIDTIVFQGLKILDFGLDCPNVKEIIFGNGIEVITRCLNYASSSREALESVKFGSTVTEIGASAFEWCKNLKSVIIPGNVKRIGKEAFSSCRGLTRVVIEEGVEEIGERAFNFNTEENAIYREVYLPESLKRLDNEAIFDWDWDDKCYSHLTIHTTKSPLLSALDRRFVYKYTPTAAEREKARQARIAQLGVELAKAKQDLTKSQQTVAALQAEQQSLDVKCSAERDRLQTLTGMFKGSQRKKCQEEIDRLQASISGNERQLHSANEDLKAANGRVQTLEKELNMLQ